MYSSFCVSTTSVTSTSLSSHANSAMISSGLWLKQIGDDAARHRRDDLLPQRRKRDDAESIVLPLAFS